MPKYILFMIEKNMCVKHATDCPVFEVKAKISMSVH